MLNCKKFFALTLVLSFIFLTSPPVQSADLGGKDFSDPPIFPVNVQNWTGFWLGLGGGYGAVNNDFNIAPAAGGGTGLNINSIGGDGGIFTVGGGYDFQIGPQWVLGALADYDWSGMKSTATGPGGGTVNLEIKSQYALGIRTGYLANPNTLLYITGGWTRLEYDSASLTAAAITGTVGAPKFDGWFLGGGVETMLGSWVGTNNVSLKLEYRYADYKREALGVAGTGVAGVAVPALEPSTHTGRLSVNYKFN